MKECCFDCCKKICTSTVRQHLGAGGVGHGALGLGILLSWSSIAVPSIVKSEEFGILTHEEISWLTSIPLLGALLFVFPTGYMTNVIGRRLSFIISGVPFIIGWILMSFSHSLALLLLGRFLAGASGGAFSVLVPLYVSEIAESKIRGSLSYSFTQQLLTGPIFVIVVGRAIGWQLFGLKCIPLGIIIIIAAYFLHESPYVIIFNSFLKSDPDGEITRGNGEKALKWFRITTDSLLVEQEIKEISGRGEVLAKKAPISQSLKKSLLKQILIPSTLMLFSQLSGVSNFIYELTPISPQIIGKSQVISVGTLTLISALVPIVTIGISGFFIDKIGRRLLLISSTLILALFSFILGTLTFVENGTENGGEFEKLGWFKIISYLGIIFSYSFGLGPISWLLLAEISPDRFRGTGASITAFCNWLPAFLIVKNFTLIKISFQIWGYLWFTTTIGLMAAIFSFLYVPETSKRTLTQIQEIFEKEDKKPSLYPI